MASSVPLCCMRNECGISTERPGCWAKPLCRHGSISIQTSCWPKSSLSLLSLQSTISTMESITVWEKVSCGTPYLVEDECGGSFHSRRAMSSSARNPRINLPMNFTRALTYPSACSKRNLLDSWKSPTEQPHIDLGVTDRRRGEVRYSM